MGDRVLGSIRWVAVESSNFFVVWLVYVQPLSHIGSVSFIFCTMYVLCNLIIPHETNNTVLVTSFKMKQYYHVLLARKSIIIQAISLIVIIICVLAHNNNKPWPPRALALSSDSSTNHRGYHPNNNKNDSSITPTPCVRICRYNAGFFNGQVCIGCFRETHEISHWCTMNAKEKAYALEDALDRLTSCSLALDGSISRNELVQQAQAWFDMSQSES